MEVTNIFRFHCFRIRFISFLSANKANYYSKITPSFATFAVRCLMFDWEPSCPGAYLGGGAVGPWPPLLVARIATSPRKVNKIETWRPPLQVGQQALGSKSPDFGQKMGQNLSEALFFFALHLILGEKWDEI